MLVFVGPTQHWSFPGTVGPVGQGYCLSLKQGLVFPHCQLLTVVNPQAFLSLPTQMHSSRQGGGWGRVVGRLSPSRKAYRSEAGALMRCSLMTSLMMLDKSLNN